jgi:hypothetical protein
MSNTLQNYPGMLHWRHICHILLPKLQILFSFSSDKYASGEASLDSCQAYLTFRESNDTLPRAPFTVYAYYEPWLKECKFWEELWKEERVMQ